MITSTTICVFLICMTVIVLALMIRSANHQSLAEAFEELDDKVIGLEASENTARSRIETLEFEQKELAKKITNANLSRMK